MKIPIIAFMRKGKNKKGFRGGGQKKETDFTKEEMRQMIAKEKSKILNRSKIINFIISY